MIAVPRRARVVSALALALAVAAVAVAPAASADPPVGPPGVVLEPVGDGDLRISLTFAGDAGTGYEWQQQNMDVPAGCEPEDFDAGYGVDVWDSIDVLSGSWESGPAPDGVYLAPGWAQVDFPICWRFRLVNIDGSGEASEIQTVIVPPPDPDPTSVLTPEESAALTDIAAGMPLLYALGALLLFACVVQMVLAFR